MSHKSRLDRMAAVYRVIRWLNIALAVAAGIALLLATSRADVLTRIGLAVIAPYACIYMPIDLICGSIFIRMCRSELRKSNETLDASGN